MTAGAPKDPGQGRSLASPAFPDDDGSADPGVRAALVRLAAGQGDAISLARRLRGERLLGSVLAVLDERDEVGGDKGSHMAVVSMVNERGERGLLAFTGMDALVAWNPEGRPVPALGRETARAALEDGAAAVVIDVAGPQPVVLAGPALTVLADDLDFDRVAALTHAALAPLTADGWTEASVIDARHLDVGADVLVTLATVGGGHPDGRLAADLAEQAASILADRADLHRLAPGGIGVTAG